MIQLRDVSIEQGDFSLRNVSLTIPEGAYGVLMGRTGSGKTTILEAVIGLREIASGAILLGGRDVTRLPPAARGIGYVPQDGALFPYMTVADQMGLALFIRNVPQREVDRRVEELAELLRITYLLQRRPTGLSGGERQRVALGRALSFRPRVLCLDEPLSALDDATRQEMIGLLSEVRKATGVTALHVTHHPDEADRLADCLLRIEGGQVEFISKRSSPAGPHAIDRSTSDRAAPSGQSLQ